MRRGLAAAAAVLLVPALAGCESSQSKSARLSKQAKTTLTAKGLTVTRENPQVKVDEGIVLHDKYGSAAVVELRNLSSTAQVALPISIAVTTRPGRRPSRTTRRGSRRG